MTSRKKQLDSIHRLVESLPTAKLRSARRFLRYISSFTELPSPDIVMHSQDSLGSKRPND